MRGLLTNVTRSDAGTAFSSAVTIGDLILEVDDATDFEETGGRLTYDGTPLAYVGCDKTSIPNTVTLAATAPTAADVGDQVLLIDELGRVATAWYAWFTPNKGGESHQALIPIPMLNQFDEGDGQAGLEINVGRDADGDGYMVLDFATPITARTTTILPEFEGEDEWVVTTPGDQTFVLSHVPWRAPLHKSLHLRWGVISLPRSAYTVDSRTVTITDQGFHVGHKITAQYDYAVDGPSVGFSEVVTVDEPEVTPTPPLSPGIPRLPVTEAIDGDSTIDCPPSAENGDLIWIFMFAGGGGTPTVTDSRINPTPIWTGGIGGGAVQLYTGFEDGSGDPFPISLTGTFTDGHALCGAIGSATALNVIVDDTVGSGATDPVALPDGGPLAQAMAFLSMSYSVVPGGIGTDDTAEWTEQGASGGGNAIAVDFWENPGSDTSTPPGVFYYSGAISSYSVMVAEIVGAP